MRNWIFLIILALACGCGDGSKKVETDYYLITLGAKFDIKKLQCYQNDSTAFAEELRRSDDFDKFCMDSTAKYMAIKGRVEAGTIEYYKAKAQIEAYSELMQEMRTLMRISHIKDYKTDEFLDIITKNGVNSVETRRYIEDNKIDVEFYPIK